jgi:ArsR family transcriptional regulator
MKPACCQGKKSNADLSHTVKFLKAISEESRLKILCMLRESEKCVCEIWQYLGLPQNLASHHLKVLKDLNLIDSRKEGLKVFYSINKRVISNYLKLLTKFLRK